LLRVGKGLASLTVGSAARRFVPRLEMPARLSNDLVAYVVSGIDNVTGREICRYHTRRRLAVDLHHERATK